MREPWTNDSVGDCEGKGDTTLDSVVEDVSKSDKLESGPAEGLGLLVLGVGMPAVEAPEVDVLDVSPVEVESHGLIKRSELSEDCAGIGEVKGVATPCVWGVKALEVSLAEVLGVPVEVVGESVGDCMLSDTVMGEVDGIIGDIVCSSVITT